MARRTDSERADLDGLAAVLGGLLRLLPLFLWLSLLLIPRGAL